MNLCKAYLRWRHSKGFGVHSPYAYKFVTNVLRLRDYGFYSYHEIDSHLSSKEIHDYRFLKLIRFTIRLVNFLNTRRIITPSFCSRLAEVTAKAADKECIVIRDSDNFIFQKRDLLIISDCGNDTKKSDEGSELTLNLSLAKSAIHSGATVFALCPHRELRALLATPIPRGLLLNGISKQILIPRPEMSYISYDIRM